MTSARALWPDPSRQKVLPLCYLMLFVDTEVRVQVSNIVAAQCACVWGWFLALAFVRRPRTLGLGVCAAFGASCVHMICLRQECLLGASNHLFRDAWWWLVVFCIPALHFWIMVAYHAVCASFCMSHRTLALCCDFSQSASHSLGCHSSAELSATMTSVRALCCSSVTVKSECWRRKLWRLNAYIIGGWFQCFVCANAVLDASIPGPFVTRGLAHGQWSLRKTSPQSRRIKSSWKHSLLTLIGC